MSYVVNVFQVDPGFSPEGVDQVMDELLRQQSLPACCNPLFVELSRQLMEDFPETAEGGAWIDGQLDGNADGAVYNIGINPDFLPSALYAVIRRARALGLAVMDEQAGAASVPDGTTFFV